MSETNGSETPKPRVNLSFSDDGHHLNAPKWLFEDPTKWQDGMSFTLHRRYGNLWELVCTGVPATVKHEATPV